MEVRVAKLGEEVKTVTVVEEATVKSALEKAGYEPREKDVLMVNGEEAGPETEIHENDIVTLVPKVKGGK